MAKNPNKPVSMKTMFSTEIPGKKKLGNYATMAAANRKVAQLKKQGYSAKAEWAMGGAEVWVSARYFKTHKVRREII